MPPKWIFAVLFSFFASLSFGQLSQAYYMQVETLNRNAENEWEVSSTHLIGLFRQSKMDDLTVGFPDGALKMYEEGETKFRFKFLAWDKLFMPDVVFVKPETSNAYIKTFRGEDHFYFTARTAEDHASLLMTIESREHLIQKEFRLFYDWRPASEKPNTDVEVDEKVLGTFIQLASLSKPPKMQSFSDLKSHGELMIMIEDDYFKIRLGGFKDKAAANAVLPKVKKSGYKKAFVLQKEVDPSLFRESMAPDKPYVVKDLAAKAPEEPKELPVIQYFVQVATVDEQPRQGDFQVLEAMGPVQVIKEEEKYKVQLIGFDNREEARMMMQNARYAGYTDAFVVQRIVMMDAEKVMQPVDVESVRAKWRYGSSLSNYYPKPGNFEVAGYQMEEQPISYATPKGEGDNSASELNKEMIIRGADGSNMDYPLSYRDYMEGGYQGARIAVLEEVDPYSFGEEIDPIEGMKDGSVFEMRGERGGVRGTYQYNALQNSYVFVPDEQEVDAPAPYEAASDISLVEPVMNLDSVSIVQNLIEQDIPVWPSDLYGNVAILGTYNNLEDAQSAYFALRNEVDDLYVRLNFEESEFGGIENKYQLWAGPYVSDSEAYLLAMMLREQKKLESYSIKHE